MEKQQKIPDVPVLGKDVSWQLIDGQFCRIRDFVPIELELVKKYHPYAIITIECKKLPDSLAIWPVINKIDFKHLQEVFLKRKLKGDEEVLIVYSSKYWGKLLKIFSVFLPKMHIMIYPKGYFEKFADINWWEKEVKGEAGFIKIKPIAEWKP